LRVQTPVRFPVNPRFFSTPGEWRAWLLENHEGETELLVGMHKRASARPSMTWSESVDEALCFGWIDAVRKSIDGCSYSIRFCVRKKASIWSKVNIAKAEALIAAGRMHSRGLRAFERRDAAKSGIYSFEQASVEFDSRAKKKFMANAEAWAFFQAQPPSYRKLATWKVCSARQAVTKERRLAKIIDSSQRRKRI
jgi:uncharacterized protein YdeI (YjbR/CyaY-like superfamily)